MDRRKQVFDLARERGLVLYSQQPAEDAMLLCWANEMVQAGEFWKVFEGRRLAASHFLELFEPPTMLFYKVDDSGEKLVYAAWLMPSWFGATVGVWVDKSMRNTHQGMESFLLSQAVAAIGFEMFDVFAGLTTNVEFLEKNQHHGYINLGKIPYKMNGRDQYWVFYTKDVWEKSAFNPFGEGV